MSIADARDIRNALRISGDTFPDRYILSNSEGCTISAVLDFSDIFITFLFLFTISSSDTRYNHIYICSEELK